MSRKKIILILLFVFSVLTLNSIKDNYIQCIKGFNNSVHNCSEVILTKIIKIKDDYNNEMFLKTRFIDKYVDDLFYETSWNPDEIDIFLEEPHEQYNTEFKEYLCRYIQNDEDKEELVYFNLKDDNFKFEYRLINIFKHLCESKSKYRLGYIFGDVCKYIEKNVVNWKYRNLLDIYKFKCLYLHFIYNFSFISILLLLSVILYTCMINFF